MAADRRDDYYRLKAGYLRFKGALFDRFTGLFAYPYLFDRIRALLGEGESLGLIYLEAAGLDLVEASAGWQESDRLRGRIAETLVGLRDTMLGPDTLLACSGVHGSGYLLFLPRSPEGEPVSENRIDALGQEIRETVHGILHSDPPSEWSGLVVLEAGTSLLRDVPVARFERQVYAAVEEARAGRRGAAQQEQVRRIADLRAILRDGRVQTHFQPILQMETGRLVGYEALSRGPRDSFFETPATMFCYSEQIGAAVELDDVCRRRALMEARDLKPGLKLFLNSLPDGIAGFGPAVGREAERGVPVPSDRIVIEITERTAIRDFPAFRRQVDRLRRQGFQIAIDDVGTGYSTLQAVSEVQPEFLKIDMSLIRDIHRNLIKRGLVSSLVEMGEKIRACVIAEGIENREEMQALMDCGVRYGQGFFFARPAPPFPTVSRSLLRDS